jgi:RNA polymerase sigma-70 factor, ECF subfamily
MNEAVPGREVLLTDVEVVAAVLAGRTELFAQLIRRYQDTMYRVAFSMVLDTDVASDVVQDALIRAFANLGQCRDPHRFRVWILRMLRNRCLDHLKERRRQDVSLDQEAHVAAARNVHPLHAMAERSELVRALESLPESLREAFLLRHIEELSYEEIAELLSTSVPAVKMRVSRARDLLRHQLSPQTAGGLRRSGT